MSADSSLARAAGAPSGRRRFPPPGWAVVAAAFFVNAVTAGCVYSFPSFVHSLRREFSASDAQIASAQLIALGLYFLLGWPAGAIADRWGARWISALGAMVAAAGLLFAARAESLWEFKLAFGLGLGIGCSFVPSLVAAMRAWPQSPGGAATTVSCGVAVGMAAMPFLAEWLIGRVGWRGSETVLGLLSLVASLSALWLLSSPSRPAAASLAATLGLSALGSRAFWHIAGAGLLAAAGFTLPYVFIGRSAASRGLADAAANLMLWIGLGNMAGRLLSVRWADRADRRLSLAGSLFGLAAVLGVWAVVQLSWEFCAVAFVFGAFNGSVVALTPPLIGDHFPGANTSAITGLSFVGVGAGSYFGPKLICAEVCGLVAYTAPMALSGAALVLLAAVLIWLIPRPPVRSRD